MHMKGLHARGHQMRVYSSTEAAHHYLPISAYVDSETIIAPPVNNSHSNHGPRHWLTKGFRSQEAEERIARLEQIKALCRLCAHQIRTDRADVLFANSSLGTYNTPIGAMLNIPSLIYLQEPNRSFYEASPRLPWLLPVVPTAHPRNPAKRLMERSRELHLNHAYRLQASEEQHWASRYDRILCNSQFSRESILRAYGLESQVCYLGIDSDEFKPRSEVKHNYVVGAGSISAAKRLEYAIMAIASIPSNQRPHLHWIGNFADSYYQEYIVRLAEQHAVTLKLHVLVSDEDLQKAMSQAACFIYTPRLEPFGLTPLEANACGTAVVAIAEGGVRETIQHGVNGLLSLNNDPCQLGEMIAKFTSNLHYAAQMGMQARDHVVKHWKVDDAVDRLEQQLLSLVR